MRRTAPYFLNALASFALFTFGGCTVVNSPITGSIPVPLGLLDRDPGPEKSPRYYGQVSVLPSPWEGSCEKVYAKVRCTISHPNANKDPRIFYLYPLITAADYPERHVIQVVLRRVNTSTAGPYKLGAYTISQGSLALEYAGTTIYAFKAKDCDARSDKINPQETCWSYYFRIPDEYPQKPFSITIVSLGVTPALDQHTLSVPAVKVIYSIDTAPLRGTLIDAAENGDAAEVRKLILAGSDLYETKGRVNQTAMLRAASLGHLDVMSALIQAGYDVNSNLMSGSTLLTDALWNKAPRRAIELLLRSGAKADSIGIENNRPYSALSIAMYHHEAEEIVPLLLSYGAPTYIEKIQETLLWDAYSTGRSEAIVRMLEKAGAQLTPPPLTCPKDSISIFKADQDGWIRWCEKSGNDSGILHGFYVAWYASMRIKLRGEYLNGARDGAWQTYNENGKSQLSEFFRNGKLEMRLLFRGDGSWLQREYFGQDSKVERIIYFDRNSNISREVRIQDGQEIPH